MVNDVLPVLPEVPALLEILVGQGDQLVPASQAVQFCLGDPRLHLSQENLGYPGGGRKEERGRGERRERRKGKKRRGGKKTRKEREEGDGETVHRWEETCRPRLEMVVVWEVLT